jgi:hypothetical protein
MGEEGGNMLGHSRGFDRRPDRPNQQSDGASSSQDQSAHSARNRSLLFSGLSTWEQHRQTSNSESFTEAERRLREQETIELDRRAGLPLDQRTVKQVNFQLERSKQLKKFEKEIKKLEVLAEGLEKRFDNPSNGNYLHHLHDRFQALDLMNLAQMQDIDDKEKNLIWMENMTNISQENEHLQFRQQERQRVKMLELQEGTHKEQLENMAKHVKEAKIQLNNMKRDIHCQMPYFTQEFTNHFKAIEQKIEDYKNSIRQRTDKIDALKDDFDDLIKGKKQIIYNIDSQLQFANQVPVDIDPHIILNMTINKLENFNSDMNHMGLSLKQRIQWLRESELRVDSAKSNPNEALEHIKTIISEKFDNLEEHDRQINQRLNNITDKLYGRHLQILQDAAKELNIELPGPKTRIWKNYLVHIYSDIDISFDPAKKEMLDSEQLLMLEDMVMKEGKCDRIDNNQRESEKYKKLAEAIVQDFKRFHDNYNKKGKQVQSQ